jgi:hypothetical protein
MSADNYIIIRKDRQGFFVPIMGFASVGEAPMVTARNPRFKEFLTALEFAATEPTEYGITVHEECYSDKAPTLAKDGHGHYPNCPAIYNAETDTEEMHQFDCICENVKSDWEKDYSALAR